MPQVEVVARGMFCCFGGKIVVFGLMSIWSAFCRVLGVLVFGMWSRLPLSIFCHCQFGTDLELVELQWNLDS